MTLPKGFLEQLPTLERFKDDEFESFLLHIEEENKHLNSTPKTSETANGFNEGEIDVN